MTYTLSPNSGFLSISGTTISLATMNVADIGPHSMVLTIAMANYLTITLTKSFTATITCVVQTLTFTTVPAASTTLKYSDSAVYLPFVTSQTPACGNTVSFAISPTKLFLSLPSPTASGGIVRISGATLADIGNYSETLTATVAGQTTTANFSIIIDDPCKTAVFQTSPAPLSTMTVNMPSSTISTQTIVIKTDVELAHSAIVCPFTATNLTPAAVFISLSANIISVNASLI
jgi:hypothetical protein